jgi:RNA recognition motif-containing protein
MKLYVGNLPWSVDDNALKELFAAYSPDEATLITDKFSGRSKGFGFVTIADDGAAQKAISEMHEKDLEGRPLTVSEARPMVPRDNAPRGDDQESGEAPMANPAEIGNAVEEATEDAAEASEEASEPEAEATPEDAE